MMMMPFICSYRNKAQAQSKEGTFSAVLQVHSCRMGREPGAGMMRVLEGRVEAVAGTMNAQNVANTLWAYARMGREPGAGIIG